MRIIPKRVIYEILKILAIAWLIAVFAAASFPSVEKATVVENSLPEEFQTVERL